MSTGDPNKPGNPFGEGPNPFSDQPTPSPYQPPQTPGMPLPTQTVKNYLVESILLLVCCAGIFAIPAIVYAAQVNGKLQAGDYQGAVDASNKAKTWCIVALCIGLVCNVIAVGFTFLGAALENA